MKFYADQKRRNHNFSIGDLVYVKLRPYRQQSITGSTYSKLSKRFYGPYKIADQFGPVAFKLDLPSHSKIHPVFHCSLLKPHHGPITTPPDDLPNTNINNHPLIQPLAILDTKLDTSTTPPQRLVLVQWLGLLPGDATWEKWDLLSSNFHLEDKVALPPHGINTHSAASTPLEDHTIIDLPKRITKRPNYLKDYVTTMSATNPGTS